jgi:NNP family nitrate/nitrite transporter-like MFS transporter
VRAVLDRGIAMKLSEFRRTGHWPTLLSAFLYFDVSFMVWTMLGALGAQIGHSLHLRPEQKGLMVATPILGGAVLRLALGLLSDRLGAKRVGVLAQILVMAGLAAAWHFGLNSYGATLTLGAVLGLAGASFAVALPQAGRWYPANMQGLVLGLAGAGNLGVVIDSLLAPRLAAAHGWNSVFGYALIPVGLVLALYAVMAKDAPGRVKAKKIADYANLLRERDAHWFCLFYTVSFGGFVGLASSLVIYFTAEYGLTPVQAGQYAALCTLIGAVGRPVGGGVADRLGGVRALHVFYSIAALALVSAAFIHPLKPCAAAFLVASGAFGMANGAVFQLLPQRFPRDLNVMTGLVGCGGGVGGFILASSLGYSKGLTGSYLAGLIAFAALCGVALAGLARVKGRWRSSWGALAEARI